MNRETYVVARAGAVLALYRYVYRTDPMTLDADPAVRLGSFLEHHAELIATREHDGPWCLPCLDERVTFRLHPDDAEKADAIPPLDASAPLGSVLPGVRLTFDGARRKRPHHDLGNGEDR